VPAGTDPDRAPLPIAVRLARPADKAAVLAFATSTWDGWDYIPQVWDAWLAAPDGVLLVACAQRAVRGANGGSIPAGQPVALARLTLLAPGEGWLEGIRVDPAVRGREVATNLQVAELAWAAAHDMRVVRYATGQENEGSHRLGARHGFTRLRDRRSYGPPEEEPAGTDPGDPSAVQRLSPDAPAAEVEGWWRLIAADPTFLAGDRLYEARRWAFQAFDRLRLAAHVRRGEVYVAPDGAALAIAPHGDGRSERSSDAGLLVGRPASALALLVALGRASGGSPRVRLPDPNPPLLAHEEAERWAAAGLVAHPMALHLMGRTIEPGVALPAAEPPDVLVLLDEPRSVARPAAP